MDDLPNSINDSPPEPETIPSMADLGDLSSELDSIDRTLAELDADPVQEA